MSFIDYDDLECKYCGHTGMLPSGDLNVECPVCDAEYSLIDEDELEYEDDEEDEDW